MFECAIKVLETEINKLERQQKCFRDEFVFRKDTKELQLTIEFLQKSGGSK